jgi:hypothetical protein
MERHTLGETRDFALLRAHEARTKGQLTEVRNGYITSCAGLAFAPQRELAV